MVAASWGPGELRGVKDWLPKLVNIFLFGQARAALNMTYCLLTERTDGQRAVQDPKAGLGSE